MTDPPGTGSSGIARRGNHDATTVDQFLRRSRAQRVINAANSNAARYHLRRGPLRFAAHSALRLGSSVAPGVMLRQFDWLYGYDVARVGV